MFWNRIPRDPIPADKQRPVIHNHIVCECGHRPRICPGYSRPGQHRIVTHNHRMSTDAYIQHGRYGFQVLFHFHFLQPVFIMISENQMLFPFQQIKILFRWAMAAEDEVSDNVNRIISVNLAIPSFDQFCIH